MDIFWNYTIQLECKPLSILDQSVLTIYDDDDDDDDDANVIFFGVQWLPKRLTPQTSDLMEVGVQAFLLGCSLIQDTFLHYVCLQPGVV